MDMSLARRLAAIFSAAFVVILLTSCGGSGSVSYQMGGSIQHAPLSLTTVSTLAGTAGESGSADDTGAAARFFNPYRIARDGTNLYVTDSENDTIRKIEISSGIVTTIAGTAGSQGSADGTGAAARFNNPVGIATDGTNLFVTDTRNHTIRKIVISTGVVTTIAGTALSPGSTDGTGAAARFQIPQGITTDGINLYVSDTQNQTIRKIVISTGVVTTIAGFAGSSGSTDGTGAAARFSWPRSIVLEGLNLYVTESANQLIRKIVISSGVVTTVAGTPNFSGSTDGTGSAARFSSPGDIVSDGTNLYVADTGNNTVRKIVISSGVVTTIAGTAGSAGATDGDASVAQFTGPSGITTDGDNLYVAEITSNTIRKIVLPTVSTLAGSVGVPGNTNDTGTAAEFNTPHGVTSDGDNLYVADFINHSIRQIEIATGVVTTLAGSGSAGSADDTSTAAEFSAPIGVTTDGASVYVADSNNHTIRQVEIATGVVTTLAGFAGANNSDDGTGATARFNTPAGLTTDGTNVYVADTLNHTIRQVEIATGVVTTLAGFAGANDSIDGTGATARFNSPFGLTTDGTNLYVADTLNHTIRKIEISSGVVTTLAGTALSNGATDGLGAAARFNSPYSVTSDGTNLYVAEYSNHLIRKIVISTGVVTTVAGTVAVTGSTNGTAAVAKFNSPRGITTDGVDLYVADTLNHTIRKIE